MKKVLTTKEASQYLGVTDAQLLRVTAEGHIRSLPGFGKPFRYSLADLNRYLNQEGPVK